MKLNNKGFAITSVLYGLLILFVVMMSSYLTVLSAKKNRLDNIVKEIENSYSFDSEYNYGNIDIDFPFTAPYTGKYAFGYYGCNKQLEKGTIINDSSELNDKDCTKSSNIKVVRYEYCNTPSEAPYTGKYVFDNKCITYLSKGTKIDNSITFTTDGCSRSEWVKIYYNEGQENE